MFRPLSKIKRHLTLPGGLGPGARGLRTRKTALQFHNFLAALDLNFTFFFSNGRYTDILSLIYAINKNRILKVTL